MNILHVYRTYFPDGPGGLQEAIRQIAHSTTSLGHENKIYSLTSNSVGKTEFFEGTAVRAKSWLSIASCDLGLYGSYKLFKEECNWADIIHYHFPWPFSDFLHMVVKPNSPSVMTYHSDIVDKGILGKLYEPLKKKMMENVDAIVATSPEYMRSSNTLNQINRDKLHMIPLGINEETYERHIEDSTSLSFRRSFGLDGRNYFLFIGVPRRYKGLDTLLRAASISDSTIVVAGSGFGTSRFTRELIKHPRIVFVGEIGESEKIDLIDHCTALILPSDRRSEAFGMVLIEASMRAKPMVTCEIETGTSYVNIKDVTGMTFTPGDHKELSQIMCHLDADPNLAFNMGRAARERYELLFEGHTLGRNYEELYLNLR